MIRYSGSSPAWESRSRPGSSLRRARSPVAPNSTITWGCRAVGIARRASLMEPGSVVVKSSDSAVLLMGGGVRIVMANGPSISPPGT